MAPCEGMPKDPHEKESCAAGCTDDLPSAASTRCPTSGGTFRGYPTNRDLPIKSYYTWIKGKRIDDDIGPYWRVHDKLYDLTDFVRLHPGGKDWIECTKGTDITEAFETSHFTSSPEKILDKYYVQDIAIPRNSPYTFHEDGFYKKLKRKALPILQKSGRGPSFEMLLIQDGLIVTFIILFFITAWLQSYILAVLTGIILALECSCAHNFIHQRDSFRIYYVDFSLFSSYEWRVTHIISHHVYTNTLYDYEVIELEPFWMFLPTSKKSFLQRYCVPLYEWAILPWAMYASFLKRLHLWICGEIRPRTENCIPVLELAVMLALVPSPITGMSLWMVIHSICSLWMVSIHLAGTHHYPDNYHEGDAPREEPDWGLCQLDAVRDKVGYVGNIFMVATHFGNHGLHHLFPTVDHSRLDQLYPVFFETCQEFGMTYDLLTHWQTLHGKYVQLAKTTPNPHPPGSKTKCE
ncbi:hypothetical protein SK128_010311 [Halocaridina rubra]|uniref:Cytochrome b5 heme-binding domain-containing protein n=1 Tax=Halocaridina rubra TaxID=373956 RepID=A0AAN8WJK2_HALRR